MRKLIFLIVLMLATGAQADDTRWRSDITSVIEDSMCIPELNGEGYLHVDEDVANLNITVIGSDGTTVAVYDAGAEQEDIGTIGTYAAPSANNVRVSPQANGGGDCTQMMFANSVYAGQDWIVITVSDAQATIMDFTRWVHLNTLTSRSTGERLKSDISGVSSQTVIQTTDGAANDDAYTNDSFSIEDATSGQECSGKIVDYTTATNEFTLDADGSIAGNQGCQNFTVAIGDIFRVRVGSSGDAVQTLQEDSDEITDGAGDGIVLGDNAVDKVWAKICGEPSGVFDWSTGTACDLVAWMAALSRNKITQTATTKTLRNDADSADLSTCAVSDNGTTFERSECL